MTAIANDAVQTLTDGKITVKRIIIGSVMVKLMILVLFLHNAEVCCRLR